MALKNIQAYLGRMGLVERTDPEIGRPIHRRPGFGGIAELGEMEKSISRFLRAKREESKLSRGRLAPLLGLSEQVYARYERAFSKMHVTRMIHLSEILGFLPEEMICAAAPHLFGDSSEEAEDRMRLARTLSRLSHRQIRALSNFLEEFRADDGPVPNDADTGAATGR